MLKFKSNKHRLAVIFLIGILFSGLLTVGLLINSINISAQQTTGEKAMETFAKICKGDVKGVVMNFAPQEITNAVQTFEIGECIATAGITCAASIVKGQIQAVATTAVLDALTTAVPQLAPAIATYNMVNGFVSAGTAIEEGCLNVNEDGLITEMDAMTISADKEGGAQDISMIFYGANVEELPEEQKIYGKDITLIKPKGKNFILRAGEKSFVKISGKEANLAGGKIEFERAIDEKGKVASVDVEKADIVIGKGGGTLKFGDYEGKFEEGTHVSFDQKTGFELEGQEGQTAELVDKFGKKNFLTLRGYEIKAQIINGEYRIEGQNFEVNGMKIYSEDGIANLIVKKDFYIKGEDTFLEVKGVKVGGGEIDIWLDGEKHPGDYFSIGENSIIIKSRKYETSLEIFKKDKIVHIIADKNSIVTILNQNEELRLRDGKVYSVISNREGIETTPLDISIENTEEKKECVLKMDNMGTIKPEKCFKGLNSVIIGKIIQMTGMASEEACITKVSVNLDNAVKFSINKDNPRMGKVKVGGNWIDVIQLKSGEWVEVRGKEDLYLTDEQGRKIVTREVYKIYPNEKKAANIGYQLKSAGTPDKDYKETQFYKDYESIVKPAQIQPSTEQVFIKIEFTETKADINKGQPIVRGTSEGAIGEIIRTLVVMGDLTLPQGITEEEIVSITAEIIKKGGTSPERWDKFKQIKDTIEKGIAIKFSQPTK